MAKWKIAGCSFLLAIICLCSFTAHSFGRYTLETNGTLAKLSFLTQTLIGSFVVDNTTEWVTDTTTGTTTSTSDNLYGAESDSGSISYQDGYKLDTLTDGEVFTVHNNYEEDIKIKLEISVCLGLFQNPIPFTILIADGDSDNSNNKAIKGELYATGVTVSGDYNYTAEMTKGTEGLYTNWGVTYYEYTSTVDPAVAVTKDGAAINGTTASDFVLKGGQNSSLTFSLILDYSYDGLGGFLENYIAKNCYASIKVIVEQVTDTTTT